MNKPIYQKYPAYKHSGVEWLGEIPEHWGVRKIKYLFKEIIERSTNGDEDLLSVSQYTGVTLKSDKVEEGDLLTNASTLEGYKKVKVGDLVSNIMLAWNGSLGFSPYDGITSPAYSIYRLNEENIKGYFHYLLRTDRYKSEFKRNSSGVIESRLRLYTDDFYKILSILPPIEEQTAIATFLDRKTEQIERAIAQKEKLIALLKERKQIVIQQAVTGKTNCLNQDSQDDKINRMNSENEKNPEILKSSKSRFRPMINSGVEWIGEIPEHWEVKALKYIAYLESGQTISSDSFVEEGFPVFGGNGFRGYAQNYTNEGEFALIGRQGALCGNVNYASGKFFASEHAIVVYHKKGVNVLWLGEAIKVADFNRLSQSAAQPGIAVNVVKNVLFPYPPIEEQNMIAHYIETQSAKIDKAITVQEQQIEKLKEYKAVLVDSAVTGKIKIV